MCTILSEGELVEFHQECFDSLMKLPNLKLQNQLIHNLLVRHLVQPKSDEIWIGVVSVKLKWVLLSLQL